MNYFTLLVFLLSMHITYAQEFNYPILKSEGQTVADFIPQGWMLLDSSSGDLNADGLSDFAAIFQYKAGIHYPQIDDIRPDTFSSYPRILLVAFRDSAKHVYLRIVQNNLFVLAINNLSQTEPLQHFGIDNNELKIIFQISSWSVLTTTYFFKYRNNEFELIRANDHSLHRATLNYEQLEYNFLDHTLILTKGSDSSQELPVTKTIRLDSIPSKNLKTLEQAYSWEVYEGHYL